MRARSLIAAVAASLLFAGCSGGGGSPTPSGGSGSSGGGGSSTTSYSQANDASIGDANALGTPIQDFEEYDRTIDAGGTAAPESARRRAAANGACSSGIEYFVPDRNGDADSTETLDFYDSACTVLARDVVRIVSALSSSAESVNLTTKLYAPGSSVPIATTTDARTITNATFDTNGYPVAADGFALVSDNTLDLASSKTIDSGRELVVEPARSGTSTFCSDSAGFNATGFPKLDKTYGWQGGVLSGGTRTASDDSVTWTGTHAGTTFKGAIGSLSISTGAQNTSCPIATPMFTLAGGTSTGTYSIPLTVTYTHGMVSSLTITGAALSNGTTLSVATNSSAAPTSPAFITGTVSQGSTVLATFGVDAYGDGTLSVPPTGAQYVIVDWHVVR